ncbi:MAG: hypothetical protein RR643_05010 [Anaerorhabdus sp.]|uniref:hypothetical protein n=1 Tax=Anaerorhabdus sp. TaxID=1872524 RepID=UPI002FC5B163
MVLSQRLKLQAQLEVITPHVYFQPPANVRMNYPCIVYYRAGIDTESANDKNYYKKNQYQATVIDADPDSLIPDKIVDTLASVSMISSFVSDNLNHTVLSIYY